MLRAREPQYLEKQRSLDLRVLRAVRSEMGGTPLPGRLRNACSSGSIRARRAKRDQSASLTNRVLGRARAGEHVLQFGHRLLRVGLGHQLPFLAAAAWQDAVRSPDCTSERPAHFRRSRCRSRGQQMSHRQWSSFTVIPATLLLQAVICCYAHLLQVASANVLRPHLAKLGATSATGTL